MLAIVKTTMNCRMQTNRQMYTAACIDTAIANLTAFRSVQAKIVHPRCVFVTCQQVFNDVVVVQLTIRPPRRHSLVDVHFRCPTSRQAAGEGETGAIQRSINQQLSAAENVCRF